MAITRGSTASALAAVAAAAALAGAPALATAQPLAQGEEMRLTIRLLGIPAGESRIFVGSPQGDVWPVVLQARTTGVASVFDIREHLTTLWDSAAGLALGHDLRSFETGAHTFAGLRFDREKGEATVTTTRKARTEVEKVAVQAGTHDLGSAVIWLRQQKLEPGDHYELPVLTGTQRYTLTLDVLGREQVAVAAGTFASVKVKAHVEVQGKNSPRGDTLVWLSDDPRRLIVQAETVLRFGAMSAQLDSYRPGAALAAQ